MIKSEFTDLLHELRAELELLAAAVDDDAEEVERLQLLMARIDKALFWFA